MLYAHHFMYMEKLWKEAETTKVVFSTAASQLPGDCLLFFQLQGIWHMVKIQGPKHSSIKTDFATKG